MRRRLLKRDINALIFGILLWIPLGLVFIPIYFIFFCVSIIVEKIATTWRPDLIPLSKVDAVFSFAPSYSRCSNVYTCQIWNVKGRIEVEAFRNHFYQCFLSSKENREKYVNLYCYLVEFLGYTFKKRVVTIDLKYHITELNLKEEGYTSIEAFIGQWMVSHDIDTKMKLRRPIWMVKIIHNSGSESTVIFKLHHGICDGYTMVHLTGKLSGEHAPYLFKDPAPPRLKKLKVLLQFPYLSGALWWRLYKHKLQYLSTNLQSDCRHKTEKEKWLISFCTLDLETVKQIRRVTQTNFVSVLMSIQVGALKRMMQEMAKNAQELEMIQETYIGHSMGWPNHPVMTRGGGMANHLTFNTIKALFQLDDPLDRLLDLDRNFRQTKIEGYPIMSFYIIFNSFKILPAFINRFLVNADLSIAGIETALTTLLCSPNPHYLLGRPVENLYLPVLPQSMFPTMKMINVPVSHSGRLDISINASSVLVKNQEFFDRLTKFHFVNELEWLRKRCQNLVD